MPRRNRNARLLPDPEELAAGTGIVIITCALPGDDAKYPCTGCRRRGFWEGDYCPACKGRIVLDARYHVTGRR